MTNKQRMAQEMALLQSIALGWDGQIGPRLIKRCSQNLATEETTQQSALDQSKIAPLTRLYNDPTTDFKGKKQFPLRYNRPKKVEPLGDKWLDTLDLVEGADLTAKPWAHLKLRR